MRKVTEDIVKAFDNCLEALSLNEFSRRTGIGIYTLRKFATRKTRLVREETWDKLYPVIKPYLIGRDDDKDDVATRIGSEYRHHHDLVDLVSNQKIILDCYGALPARDKVKILNELNETFSDNDACYELSSLSADENRILALYDSMCNEKKEEFTINLVNFSTDFLKIKREEMF